MSDEDDDGMRAAWLYDPRGIAPSLCLLEVPEPKTVKNRLHFDLVVSRKGRPEEQWRLVTDKGEDGLQDRSSRPHRCPRPTPASVEERIVAVCRGQRRGQDWIGAEEGVAAAPSRGFCAATRCRTCASATR